MSKIALEDVLHLLTGYNYWWQSGNVVADKVPLVRRIAFYNAMRLMQKNQVVLLHGGRQVGKSTILFQIIQELINQGVSPNRIVYIPLNHPAFKFFSPREILRMYHDNVYAPNDTFHFFDEIQCVSNWADWMTVICGKGREKTSHIVAAGTLVPLQPEQQEQNFSCVTVQIPTLSFYEYCTMFAADEYVPLPQKFSPHWMLDRSRQQQTALLFRLKPLRKHFARYIHNGGFPDASLTEQDLQSAVSHTLYTDMATTFGVRNIEDMERIFLHLCFQERTAVSLENIAKSLGGISRKTVEKYVTLLEKAGLIYISNPVSLDGTPLQKSQPKIYISDIATRNAMRMMGRLRTDQDSLNYGIEVSTFRQLKSLYVGTDTTVGYSRVSYRKKTVDIVVNEPKGKTFVDIVFQDEYQIPLSAPILAFVNEARYAFVLTKKEADFGSIPNFPNHLYRIPAHAYLYMLGHYEEERIRSN